MHGNFEIATLPGFLLGMGALGFACGFPGEEEQSHWYLPLLYCPTANPKGLMSVLEWVMSGPLRRAFRKKLSAQSVLVTWEAPELCVQSQNLTIAE